MGFKKYSTIFFNVFTFIIAFFVSLVLGECIARVFHLSKTHNSYSHLVCIDKKTGYPPHKNSYGWKDREFTKVKKRGAVRIACIGDSVTEGYRIETENTFPKVLESRLQGLRYDAEVMNLGRGGNDTVDNLKSLKVAMEFSPDIIIYQFGMNDIESFEHRERCGVSIAHNRPRENKDFNIKAVLRKSVLYLALAERYNYFKLMAGCKNWAFTEWDIKDYMWEKEFFKLKNGFSEVKDRVKIMVCYMPYDFQVYSSSEEALASSERIHKFCMDNHYYFVDFTKIFRTQRNKYGIFLDDAHLSEYGNRIAGEYLADFVANKMIR